MALLSSVFTVFFCFFLFESYGTSAAVSAPF
jgi:hypothetical protein